MIDESLPILASALLLGFVGSGHCIGMCGGIAGALGQMSETAGGRAPLLSSSLYSTGRIGSYALMGAFAGGFGESVTSIAGLGPTFRVLAGVMIIAFGLHTFGFVRGLAHLERLGLHVWRRLSPLVAKVGPPDRAWKQLLLGALWGWLPCGLVYSALAAAAVTGTVASGSAFMLCFGLGTMPALVFATGAASQLGELLRRQTSRRAIGMLLVAFGAWTIYFAVAPAHGDHGPQQHQHHEQQDPEPKPDEHEHHHGLAA